MQRTLVGAHLARRRPHCLQGLSSGQRSRWPMGSVESTVGMAVGELENLSAVGRLGLGCGEAGVRESCSQIQTSRTAADCQLTYSRCCNRTRALRWFTQVRRNPPARAAILHCNASSMRRSQHAR